MTYIIGLFLVLGLVFWGVSGHNLGANIFDNLKSEISSLSLSSILPKSEKQKQLDNLAAQEKIMQEFFSNSTGKILESKDIPTQDKTAFQNAAAALNNAQESISNLQNLESQDNGIINRVINKVLNLNSNNSPDPTSIPPQCHLQCP